MSAGGPRVAVIDMVSGKQSERTVDVHDTLDAVDDRFGFKNHLLVPRMSLGIGVR